MAYYLGVDVGGTKTHAIVSDSTGRVLGFGHTGAGNPEGVGYDGLVEALHLACGEAIHAAGIKENDIAGAGFGVAGYDFPAERQPTLQAIKRLGLSCSLEVVNDVILGLIAGSRQGWGVVIDSGTGNNVRGRDLHGHEGWVTGCGPAFGEYGGASDMVQRAIQAISHQWSTRGPETQLAEQFIEVCGASSLTDLIEGLALERYHIHSGYARLVFETAQAGDRVAQEVIAWVATELGHTANAVVHQLHFQELEFEVVLIGSVFNGGTLFIDPLEKTIQDYAPRASFSRLRVPPVTGGVLLGMEQAGLEWSAIRETLLESAQQFLK
jgi:N-acetylglucosamine kinase-like BadF-type ATPase